MNFPKLSLVAFALFAASSAFASDKACCATTTANEMKQQGCSATFANLDLNADQTAKMKKLAADCDKSGCAKQSMTQMEKAAKGILSKEQFAAWKAACSGMSHKTQS
ncbi:MAG: hypothetical protein ABR526_00405 [Chthoniobacterales bacterium]